MCLKPIPLPNGLDFSPLCILLDMHFPTGFPLSLCYRWFFFSSLLYCSHQNIKLYNGSHLKKEPLLTPQSNLPRKFSPCLLPVTDIHRHFLKNVFQDTQTHIHLFIIALYCLTHFLSKYLFQIYMVISEPNQ